MYDVKTSKKQSCFSELNQVKDCNKKQISAAQRLSFVILRVMKLNNTFLRSCLLGLVAVVVAACSSSSGPAPEGYYRVRAGDNLYKISRRYNQNVNTLIRLNNLRDASQIEVGQLIRVRSGSGVSTLSSRHQVSSRRSVSL